MYWKYFKYLAWHKWYIFLECWKTRQFIHGITHDLSKFRPSEFIPFVRKFYGNHDGPCPEIEHDFQTAVLHHYRRNKHHWNYWTTHEGRPMPMPLKYVEQMVADWVAMGRVKGDTAKEFFNKNRKNMVLHHKTYDRIVSALEKYD